jgi:hypothetical protein
MSFTFIDHGKVAAVLVLALTEGCAQFALQDPADLEMDCSEVRKTADAFLIEKLGESVVEDKLVFNRVIARESRGHTVLYRFVDNFHLDFNTPIEVFVSAKGEVHAPRPLPPCANQPDECENFITWDMALRKASGRQFLVQSNTSSEFKLHQSAGAFVWEVTTVTSRGNPSKGQTVSIDATSGEQLGSTEWIQFCCGGDWVKPETWNGRQPILLEGSVTGMITRTIKSTVISYEY